MTYPTKEERERRYREGLEREAARAKSRAAWIKANPEAHAKEQAALQANRERIQQAFAKAKAQAKPQGPHGPQRKDG